MKHENPKMSPLLTEFLRGRINFEIVPQKLKTMAINWEFGNYPTISSTPRLQLVSRVIAASQILQDGKSVGKKIAKTKTQNTNTNTHCDWDKWSVS